MTNNELLECTEVDPNKKRIRTNAYGGVRYLLARALTSVPWNNGEATISRPWFIVSVKMS